MKAGLSDSLPPDREFFHSERGAANPAGEAEIAADGIDILHEVQDIPRDSYLSHGIGLIPVLDPKTGRANGKIT